MSTAPEPHPSGVRSRIPSIAPMAPGPDLFQPGDRVGEFNIVTRLRHGGMATLYLAQRTGAGGFAKHVALKVIHVNLATDARFREMFLDEARLCARIQHPNVVHVESLLEAAGTYFLVMEFVPGCTLSMLLRALSKRERLLSPELAVNIAMQIADGLHGAHQTRGAKGELLDVVHRDVSPDNVMLAYAGHVKLVDFGIAKADGRAGPAERGLLMGKFRYMAPEQATGAPVDRRTDVYAVGIVLWEMLTGRRLFQAESDFALLQLVANPRVGPPSKYAPRLPPALDAAVLAALAPDPAARPGTANELRRMLGEAMPSALSVDSTRISELLQNVLHDKIEAERLELPSGVGFVPHAPAEDDDEEVLATMTLSVDDILLPEDVASASHPRVGHTGSQQSLDRASPPARRRVPRVVLAAVIVLLAAAGAIAAALLLDRGDAERRSPVARAAHDPGPSPQPASPPPVPPIAAPATAPAPPPGEPAALDPATGDVRASPSRRRKTRRTRAATRARSGSTPSGAAGATDDDGPVFLEDVL